MGDSILDEFPLLVGVAILKKVEILSPNEMIMCGSYLRKVILYPWNIFNLPPFEYLCFLVNDTALKH